MLSADSEMFEISTAPAENRPYHRRPATPQMVDEVHLPLHGLRRSVAVVELQRKLTVLGRDGDDVVYRSAQVPQPDVAEVVAASQLARETESAATI